MGTGGARIRGESGINRVVAVLDRIFRRVKTEPSGTLPRFLYMEHSFCIANHMDSPI